jgi:hypothetical protein
MTSYCQVALPYSQSKKRFKPDIQPLAIQTFMVARTFPQIAGIQTLTPICETCSD